VSGLCMATVGSKFATAIFPRVLYKYVSHKDRKLEQGILTVIIWNIFMKLSWKHNLREKRVGPRRERETTRAT
jgi:hypothetical protein